jgi:hypothetical protein
LGGVAAVLVAAVFVANGLQHGLVAGIANIVAGLFATGLVVGTPVLYRTVSGIFVRDGYVGHVTLLGTQRRIPVTKIDHVALCRSPAKRGYPARPTFFIVGESPDVVLRIRGDGYDSERVIELLRSAGISTVGSLGDELDFDDAAARYRGAYGVGDVHPVRTVALLVPLGVLGTLMLVALLALIFAPRH